MSYPKRVPVHPDGYKAEAYAIASIFGWSIRHVVENMSSSKDTLHSLSFIDTNNFLNMHRIRFTDWRSGRIDLDEFLFRSVNYDFDNNYNADSLKEEGITDFDDWLFSSLVWAIRERKREVDGVIYEPISYSSIEELQLKAIAQGLVS